MFTGLKVWSINPLAHYQAALSLAEQNLCDFVEIYVVPGSLELSSRWKDFPGRKVIHAPHLAQKLLCPVQKCRQILPRDAVGIPVHLFCRRNDDLHRIFSLI